MINNKFNRYVFVTIVLALAVRIILPLYFAGTWLTTDSKNYILQANDLIGGKFGLYFPNGYPAIIAAATLLFGNAYRDLSLIILNIVLSTTSVILFWLLVKKYFGANKFALTALILFAFYPNQLNYVRFILTEVPSLFFLILSFYFLSRKELIIASVIIGIAATIKTSLLAVILIFLIYLLYKKHFADGLKYLAFALIPLLMMMIYGFIITGKFTLGYSGVHNFYITVDQSGLKSTNLTDGINYYLNFAITQPAKFIIERIYSLWEFWGFLPAANEGLRENLFFRLLVGIRFPLLLLAVYGFIKTNKDVVVIFSAVVIISITLVHLVFYSIPRYNYVVEPFLIFLGVLGLKEFFLRSDKQ